jgi:hypothetical protein
MTTPTPPTPTQPDAPLEVGDGPVVPCPGTRPGAGVGGGPDGLAAR